MKLQKKSESTDKVEPQSNRNREGSSLITFYNFGYLGCNFSKNDLEILHIHAFISNNIINFSATHLIQYSNNPRRFFIFNSLLTTLFERDCSLQVNQNR